MSAPAVTKTKSYWRCYQCGVQVSTGDPRSIIKHLLSQKHQWKSRELAPWLNLVSRSLQIRLGRDFSRDDLESLIEWLRQQGELTDLVVCCGGREFPANNKPVPRGTSLVVIFSTPATVAKLLRCPSEWLTGGTEFDLCRLDPMSVAHTIIANSRKGPSSDTTPLLVQEQPVWYPRLRQLLSSREPADAIMTQMRTCLLLTQQENIQRLDFCQHLQAFLSERLRLPCVLHPYGSCVSGLAFTGSDLDLFAEIEGMIISGGLPPVPGAANLSGKARRALAKKQLHVQQMAGAGVATGAQMAKRVANALRTAPRYLVSGAIAIANAAVPIVRVRVPAPLRCECDISFSNQMGRCNSLLLYELLRADDRVHQLAVSVRAWSQIWQLSGGHFSPKKLSSYCLTLLIIVYLQQLEKPLLPSVAMLQRSCTEGPFIDGWNVGFDINCLANCVGSSGNLSSPVDLLYGFLEFYGRLDYENVALSPFLGAVISRDQLSPQNAEAPVEFCHWFRKMETGTAKVSSKYVCVWVQDPFNLSCNVARNFISAGLGRFQVACRLSARMQLLELFSADNIQLLGKHVPKKSAAGDKRSAKEMIESVAGGGGEMVDTVKKSKQQPQQNSDDGGGVGNVGSGTVPDTGAVTSSATGTSAAPTAIPASTNVPVVQPTKKRPSSTIDPNGAVAAKKKRRTRLRNCDDIDEDNGAVMSPQRCSFAYWQRIALNHIIHKPFATYLQINLKDIAGEPFPRLSKVDFNSCSLSRHQLQLKHVASARALAALLEDVFASVLQVSYYAFDFGDGVLSRRFLAESAPTIMAVGGANVSKLSSDLFGSSSGGGNTAHASGDEDNGCSINVSLTNPMDIASASEDKAVSTESDTVSECTNAGSKQEAVAITATSVCDNINSTNTATVSSQALSTAQSVEPASAVSSASTTATLTATGISQSTPVSDVDMKKPVIDSNSQTTAVVVNGATPACSVTKEVADTSTVPSTSDTATNEAANEDKDEETVMSKLGLPLGRVVAAMKCTIHSPIWYRRRCYGVFSKRVGRAIAAAEASQASETSEVTETSSTTTAQPNKRKQRSRNQLEFERESTQLALADGLQVDVTGKESFRCYVVLGDHTTDKDTDKPVDTSQAVIYVYRGVIPKGSDHVSTMYHFMRPLIRSIALNNNYMEEFGGGQITRHSDGQ